MQLHRGECRQVEILLRPAALASDDSARHNWKIEAGEYKVLLGTSSRDIRLSPSFKLDTDRTFDRF